MFELIDKLHTSSAELESAAYGELSKTLVPASLYRHDDTAYLYERVAKGYWCKQTTLALAETLAKTVGRHIRREEHADWCGEHYFLTVPVLGSSALLASDIIVDPTYKQFMRPELSCDETLPNIFIGTRLAAFEFMHTPEFHDETHGAEDWSTTPEIYLAGTLRNLETI